MAQLPGAPLRWPRPGQRDERGGRLSRLIWIKAGFAKGESHFKSLMANGMNSTKVAREA